MGSYSYKDLCYSIPSKYEEGFKEKYGRDFDNDANYSGDYWVIAADYVDDLNLEISSLKAELEALKTQEPFGYFLPDNGGNVFTQSKDNVRIAERFNWSVICLFKKPVYQHSFTIDGHTFYADNEVDILCLERKFGVGGKSKLNLVEDK